MPSTGASLGRFLVTSSSAQSRLTSPIKIYKIIEWLTTSCLFNATVNMGVREVKHFLPPSSQTIISLCSLKDGANFSLINVIKTLIQGPKHHQGGLYVSCKEAHFDIILCMRVSLELKRRGIMFPRNIL